MLLLLQHLPLLLEHLKDLGLEYLALSAETIYLG